MSAPPLWLARVDAPPPIGRVLLAGDGRSLLALDFGAPDERLTRLLRARFGPDVALAAAADPLGLVSALQAYFEGEVAALDKLPAECGGSAFQRRVWAALREIPPGQTRSYGEIARQIGKPNAARAVGMANALNPVSLVVPCHRVIGANGSLTGYGGGIVRKRWLLAHELRHVAGTRPSSRLAPDLFTG